MILLDTNYLIRILVNGSEEADQAVFWFETTELCTSTVVWYEFLSGPVDAEGVEVIQALLRDRILPYNATQAAESARLFEATGRMRWLRVTSMIAASAIISNVTLATKDTDDFRTFVPFGLKML
jgi:predicted nucleic acid-binding protein